MPARRLQSRARLAARGCAGLVIAAALASCDFAPPYRALAPETPASFKEAAPWRAASPKDEAPLEAWWSAFRDPRLDDLEAQVDTTNPTLAAAVAAYDRARAFAAEAQSSLSPTVSGVDYNTYNRQSAERPLRGAKQPNEYAVNTLGGQINYELDVWGRLRNALASGRALAQASAADLAAVRLSLHAELALDYLQLRGLDAQADLLASTVAAYAKALRLTQARRDGGVASGVDVERARTQLANAQAQVDEIAAARALFEHAVASLVGRTASMFSIPPTAGPRTAPSFPAGVPSTLIERRPDVAAAERRAFAANRQIGVARAAYFPQLTLNGLFGWQNTGGNSLLTAPDTFWTLGPQLAFTLFDGGYRQAATAASKANFIAASESYRATVLNAFEQVEDQLALARRYASEAQKLADAALAAQAVTRLSLTRYRDGAANYLDVVIAQTAELQTEQAALALETRREAASVNLARALGGGWTSADLPSSAAAASIRPPSPGAAKASPAP